MIRRYDLPNPYSLIPTLHYLLQEGGAALKYLFREDGLRLWSILHSYLEGVVGRMYPTDDMVRRDGVVQVPPPPSPPP